MINVIKNILNIKHQLESQGLEFNLTSISNLQLEPIWNNSINKSYCIFELLSGYFVRESQKNIKDQILRSIFGFFCKASMASRKAV